MSQSSMPHLGAALLLFAASGSSAMDVARAATEPAQRWGLSIFGTEIGYAGLEPVALPGRTELLVTTNAQTGFWYSLTSDGPDHYRSAFVGENVGPFIKGLTVEPPRPDHGQRGRIYLTDLWGEVEVLDAEDKTLLHSLLLERDSGSTFRKVVAFELDGKPGPEFVTTSSKVCVHSSVGARLWCDDEISGSDIVVGQMDLDDSMEFATSEGWVFDIATQRRQWQFSPFLTGDLEVADLDGDGNLELLGSPQTLRAWDVETESELWTLPGAESRGPIAVGNFDRDPAVEVAFVGQGGLNAYDTSTLLEEWTFPGSGFGTRDFAVVDLDHDGETELIFGLGAGSSAHDFIDVLDAASGELEWQSLSLDGPFLGPELADVDCDNRAEMVVATGSSNGGSAPGWIMLLDPLDLSVRASTRAADQHARKGLGLAARDIDGDGCFEVLFAGGDGFQAVLEAWSYSPWNGGFELDWTNTDRPPGVRFVSVDAVDLDGDRRADLFVAGVDGLTTASEGHFLYAYSADDGREVWRSENLGRIFAEVRAVDIDSDGQSEVVALGTNLVYPFPSSVGDLYVFDAASGALEHELDGEFTDMDISWPPSPSPTPLIRLVGTDGKFSTYGFDEEGFSLIDEIQLVPGRIEGFAIAEDTIWFGSDRRLQRYRRGAVDWASGKYGTFFGRRVALPFAGGTVAAGKYGLLLFATGEPPQP